jgi:hypothetical protein
MRWDTRSPSTVDGETTNNLIDPFGLGNLTAPFDSSDNLATYRLATAGKKGSFTAKNAQMIKLRSAVYDAVDDTVTLIPKKAFALTKKVPLLISGQPPSGLQDSSGRFIDGHHNGTAGGNAIAILSRGGASIDAVVDALFERDELVGVTPSHRDRREVRLGER